MVRLEEFHLLGRLTGPYPYNVLAPGAPIDLVKLATVYQASFWHVRYHDFQKGNPEGCTSSTDQRKVHQPFCFPRLHTSDSTPGNFEVPHVPQGKLI